MAQTARALPVVEPLSENVYVVAWRASQLLSDTWQGEPVWLLAENLDVDYRDALALRDSGCPVELALRILT